MLWLKVSITVRSQRDWRYHAPRIVRSVTLGTILKAALEKPTAVNDGSFVLEFKGMECNVDYLDLHRRDIDDELDDEEIGLGAIILDSDMVDHEGTSDSDSD
jgi:hypothetical protein